MKKIQSKIEDALDLDSPGQGPFTSAASFPANVPPLAQPPTHRQIYRFRKQRGVNLGSWFTLEDWLTPSLYQQAVAPKSSEMDVVQGMGVEGAKTMLENHWNNFINEGDWDWLVAHGINTVRIPVGYYHFLPGHPNPEVRALMKGTEYEPFAGVYVNAWKHVCTAIERAKVRKIGVLIDLHAAPGAQNKDNHSGLSSQHAGLWDSEKYQRRTVQILVAMAQEIVGYDNVVGLEVLNEPANNNRLQGWYDEAIAGIQSIGPQAQDVPLYISDSWDTNHYGKFGGSFDFSDSRFMISREIRIGTFSSWIILGARPPFVPVFYLRRPLIYSFTTCCKRPSF